METLPLSYPMGASSQNFGHTHNSGAIVGVLCFCEKLFAGGGGVIGCVWLSFEAGGGDAEGTEPPSPIEIATADPYEQEWGDDSKWEEWWQVDEDEQGDTSDTACASAPSVPAPATPPMPKWSQRWRHDVAPNTRGRSTNLTQEEIDDLREESEAAKEAGIHWYNRGPGVTGGDGDVECWRGQGWRHGANGGAQR